MHFEKIVKKMTKDEELDSIIGTGARLDHIFGLLRDAIKNKKRVFATRFIDMAEKEILKSSDWERKNKLAIYKGVVAMMDRDFKAAADVFVKSLATFTPCDLISFRDFVFYTVVTSIVSLDRLALTRKILGSPEILSVVGQIDHLSEFLVSLCECRYKEYFMSFALLIDSLRDDPFLGMHLRYLTRSLRLVAYRQFLLPYKSVTIEMMATAFGVSLDFIEAELSAFIAAEKLHCKVDRLNKVVESNRMEEARNVLYGRIVKSGDSLLNQLQKLSRVIDV